MDVLVVGASRGSGAAAVRALVADGHRVTAFARSASRTDFGAHGPGEVLAVDGDVMDDDALAKAVIGQDAVLVTLGISDNAVRVRLTRRAGTPLDVRSEGTRRVVAAMESHGVRRLVVQTTYGLGASWARLPLSMKAVLVVLLRPQLRDSARQEEVVRAGSVDWTFVRPVTLTDDITDAPAHVDTADGHVGMKVARTQVARVLADAVAEPATVGHVLSVSA